MVLEIINVTTEEREAHPLTKRGGLFLRFA